MQGFYCQSCLHIFVFKKAILEELDKHSRKVEKYLFQTYLHIVCCPMSTHPDIACMCNPNTLLSHWKNSDRFLDYHTICRKLWKVIFLLLMTLKSICLPTWKSQRIWYTNFNNKAVLDLEYLNHAQSPTVPAFLNSIHYIMRKLVIMDIYRKCVPPTFHLR